MSSQEIETTVALQKKKPKSLTKTWERIVEAIFFVSACIAILSVILITVYIFIEGSPLMIKYGVSKFVFGTNWNPAPTTMEPSFGIFNFIVASILGTLGAIVIGVSIGLFTAVFLAEIAPKFAYNIFKPAIELLAGIPSVIYGFFGLVVIVPMIKKYLVPSDTTEALPGNSLLAVIIILSIMILPTIINISETSLRAVPREYKEGSLALGATHIQTIFKVMIPAAKSGIMASIVLGTGRAIGETMAVILVAGNRKGMLTSILSPVRTMTANIALEMGYAYGDHKDALMATGVVLFVFIMALNIVFNLLIHKAGVQDD